MKKEYLIIDYNWDPVFTRDTKKEIKSDLKDYIKGTWFTFNDFRIFKLEYNTRNVYSYLEFDDFWFYNKTTDELIEYNDFSKYWIKENEIKKDFLYLNSK